VEVRVLGSDNDLKCFRMDARSWSRPRWLSEGGLFSNAPVVLSRKESQTEILAPTPDGRVLYRLKQDHWTNYIFPKAAWRDLGGTITSPLASVSWAPNRIDIFALGVNGRLLHKALNYGSWLPSENSWDEIGSGFTSPPEVISSTSGKLDIFCIKKDRIHYKRWDGSSGSPSKSDWKSMPCSVIAPPAVVALSPTQLKVFAVGSNGVMFRWVCENGQQMGQLKQDSSNSFISRPSAVSSGGGRYDIFCVQKDHQLCQKTWTGSEWIPGADEWKLLGGYFVAAPTAISRGPGKVEVFCKGEDGEIYHMDMEEEKWRSLGRP
jgi:hypothetical protein